MSLVLPLPAPDAEPGALPAPDDFAGWSDHLDVPVERIRRRPPPGTATIDDLIVANGKKPLCELIDGALVEKAVGWDQGFAAMLLGSYLTAWVEERDLGSVVGADGGYTFVNDRVRLPDVSFLSAGQLARLPARRAAYPAVAPDLAVEVFSPSNRAGEIRRKLREFFATGTQLAWVVNRNTRTVMVHRPGEEPVRLTEADTLTGDPVLPGFALSLATYFARLHRTWGPPPAAPPAP